MAFKDLEKILYDGHIKLTYRDKAHRYYVKERMDFNLPEHNAKAWGKTIYPKGTTTLLDEILEKKGLMTWPMGLSNRELFGFYDFNDQSGIRRTGFSKGVGTLWDENGNLMPLSQETALTHVLSASRAYLRKRQRSADIGNVVHDAIEHFIMGRDFDVAEHYRASLEAAEMDEGERQIAREESEASIGMANNALYQFMSWWQDMKPVVYGAEELVYSRQYNLSGTFDASLGIRRGDQLIRVTADWKTSNASTSKEAAMPEGINYQYFLQAAIYELARREMGDIPADDLMLVSCRKDGGFSVIFASELGYSIGDCISTAEAVIRVHRWAQTVKAALLDHAPATKQPVLEGEPF